MLLERRLRLLCSFLYRKRLFTCCTNCICEENRVWDRSHWCRKSYFAFLTAFTSSLSPRGPNGRPVGRYVPFLFLLKAGFNTRARAGALGALGLVFRGGVVNGFECELSLMSVPMLLSTLSILLSTFSIIVIFCNLSSSCVMDVIFLLIICVSFDL